MSEEPRRPVWKDPFVILFVIGALLVTLAAPRFRRIAPPPEVTGALPAFSLTDQDGRVVGPADLGGVTLMGLVSVRQPDPSRTVTAGLEVLQPRFGIARARVNIVLLDLDAAPAPARKAWLEGLGPEAASWRVLGGEGACELAAAVFAAPPAASPCDSAVIAAREARLALVDATGQVRGLHGSAPSGLYETFERTLRACDLAGSGGG